MLSEPDPLHAYRLLREPYYRASADEVSLFAAAYGTRLPMMLKGPTGCGKTRFVEHMAYALERPLVTVACHEDTTAADLVGRYLLDARGTHWQDGPVTLAARHGAICYLDEIVEARQDTTVVLHPLSDARRILPLEKKNEVLSAHADFMLVISYNPGYQSALKDLKISTRQRFGGLELGYPTPANEAEIVAHEAGLDIRQAGWLAELGARTRAMRGDGLAEGASTRMLVHAAQLMAAGMARRPACRMSIITPLSDDPDTHAALDALLSAMD